MPISAKRLSGQGRTIRVPLPKTRGPFINAPLISLGVDAAGEERFWISTWNAYSGCLAVLVTESGKHRIYRFPGFDGFYSAVLENQDTLWLCGFLSEVVRLTLSSGRYETFKTGAQRALVVQGMMLDPASGKLFAATFVRPTTTMAFSFDYRKRKPVKVHEDISPDKYMRCSFPNGDGTYSFILHCPGQTLGRWDPRSETVECFQFDKSVDIADYSGGTTGYLIADDQGRRYFPGRGWYVPATRTFEPQQPPPEKEMTWFARRGAQAWGIVSEAGSARLGVWDLASGKVRKLATIPDSLIQNATVSRSGKIVAVTVYGDFMRFDGATGALELARRLPADAVGSVDCICRIDQNRILGTPFISQRFWEVNIKTRKGQDCGRAAPGWGEILRTWQIGGKVYLAAYGGGELMEYDPSLPPRFPENPRVVADPPHGMRPVAAAQDGRRLFYACSHEYGMLGSVLTRYDTRTGETFYRDDPLPAQQINSLWYDRVSGSLLCGTTMQADCESAPPATDRCYFARIDARTFEVLNQAPAPPGSAWARVIGAMGRGLGLCSCSGNFPDGTQGMRWFVVNTQAFAAPPLAAMHKWPDEMGDDLVFTGRPGLFVYLWNDRCELWDWRKQQCVDVLFRGGAFGRCTVQGDSVFLIQNKQLVVLDGCLKGRR